MCVMDLGIIKCHRYGTNWLDNAINRKHGLIWSNGSQVFLTREWLKADCSQVRSKVSSLVLGEFTNIANVGWSSLSNESPMVTVIHYKNGHELPTLTLWKFTQLEKEINLTKTLEYNLPDSPLNQGFLWNDNETFLVLPCKRSAHIFRFTLGDCTDSYINANISIPSWCPPKSQFRSAVCSTTKVYLAIETHILVYDLSKINGEILGPTLTIDIGYVRSMIDLKDVIVCASEISPKSLIKSDQAPGPSSADTRESPLHSLTNISKQGSGSAGISIHLLSKSDGTLLSEIKLSGILTPDLLAGNVTTGNFLVGSTSARFFQVYSLVTAKAIELKQLSLDANQRPKGVTFHGNKLVLAFTNLSGEQQDILVPVTDFVEQNMTIKLVTVKEIPKTLKIDSSTSYNLSPSVSSSGSQSKRNASAEELSGSSKQPIRRIPLKNIQQSSLNAYVVNANVLTDELIQNLTDKLKVSLRHMSDSPHREGYKSSPESPKERSGLAEDDQHLISITSCSEEQAGDNRCADPYPKSPVNSLQVETSRCASIEEVRFYSDIGHAEWINVHFHRPNSPDLIENILLEPGGRLQLSALQRVFQLENVRLLIGDVYCYIPVCSHGYIPILFKHRQEIHVMMGNETDETHN